MRFLLDFMVGMLYYVVCDFSFMELVLWKKDMVSGYVYFS